MPSDLNFGVKFKIEPLVTFEDLKNDKTKQQVFRNPLLEAKHNIENECHFHEGLAIAKNINRLINSGNYH